MASFLAWLDRPLVNEEDAQGRPRSWTPMLGHLAAMLCIAFLGVLLARYDRGTGLVGISLVISMISLAVGGGVGFLFAIPRVAAQAEAEAVVAAATAAATPQGQSDALSIAADERASRQTRRRLMNTNNNLEKVSDWLTTMLVGVGLTQLGNIDSALFGFRRFLAETAILYPDAGANQAGVLPLIGPMLLVGGLVVGFVYFYVFTRVVIAPKFYSIEVNFSGHDTSAPIRVRAEQDVETIKSVAQELPANTSATRAVAAASAPSVDDALSVMFDALYQPDGYINAIRVASALQATDAINRPDYWFYLAAARGQEFSAVTDDAQRAAAKIAALYAAGRAIELSPSYRSRLWQISDPNGFDNDLAPFRDDPAFAAMVGRSQSGEAAPARG